MSKQPVTAETYTAVCNAIAPAADRFIEMEEYVQNALPPGRRRSIVLTHLETARLFFLMEYGEEQMRGILSDNE